MQTDHASNTPTQALRSFFRLEDATKNALIQMAMAHELVYTGPNGEPLLTAGARSRLLNIGFTRSLRSIAQRRDGNPFSSTERLSPESTMHTIYKRLVSDQPNAIQELFTTHLEDLRAYLEASALPRTTFLFVCSLFVIDAQSSQPS